MKKNLLVLFLTAACSFVNAQSIYNIVDYGAKGDAVAINTESIQKAIDRCSSEGGGTVLVPNGIFMTGAIRLKNNVALYLDATAILKGVDDLAAYFNKALVYAESQDNISISGPGKIHGHGDHPVFQSDDPYNGIKNVRPFAILFDKCTNVRLKEFTLNNSAFWCIKLLQCNNVTVDDINVISRVVANNDGIDITDCFNVRLANSFFDCGDDAICPKSESEIGVKKLVITNCIIKSESNGIKFGTASIGGFEDIAISNCHIYDTRLAGIALELVDGGIFDRITINNITMHNVNGGLFIKLGHRKGGKSGILRNIVVSNLIATGIGMWKPDTTKYHKPPHSPKIGMTITDSPVTQWKT
jgi:polygalacturonase